MDGRNARVTLMLAAAQALLGAASAQGQSTGSIRGAVYDSTAQSPLVDAAVFLWGTPHRSSTDSLGRFRIEGVPPGDYTLYYFHTRLGEMGISPGPTPVSIVADSVVQLDLGTPSLFTSFVSECLFADRRPGTGALAGWVGDGETGMSMPGAQVSLSWSVSASKEPVRMALEADGAGWYRTCDAPSGVPITASARFLDRQGLRREVQVRDGGTAEAGFLLWELEPSRVTGRVSDATTGRPIDQAEVWLRGTSFRGLTSPDGEFKFGAVPPGTYMMFVEHIGYGVKQDTLEIPSGETVAVDMRVDTRAVEIAPITVTVEARPATERAMGGITITRDAIDKVRTRVRDVADIVQAQNISGVIIRRNSASGLCIGYAPGQVRMMFNTGCVPMTIFINNVRATNAELALQMPPESVDRVILYRPVEAGALFGAGSANGVIAIYTRNR